MRTVDVDKKRCSTYFNGPVYKLLLQVFLFHQPITLDFLRFLRNSLFILFWRNKENERNQKIKWKGAKKRVVSLVGKVVNRAVKTSTNSPKKVYFTVFLALVQIMERLINRDTSTDKSPEKQVCKKEDKIDDSLGL